MNSHIPDHIPSILFATDWQEADRTLRKLINGLRKPGTSIESIDFVEYYGKRLSAIAKKVTNLSILETKFRTKINNCIEKGDMMPLPIRESVNEINDLIDELYQYILLQYLKS